MRSQDSGGRYSRVAILLHWLSATLIIAMLGLGFAAAFSTDPQRTAAILKFHVPLGSLILVLTGFRAVWTFLHRGPPLPGEIPPWQRIAAKTVHMLLYVVIFSLCASGLTLVIESGAANAIFGDGATLPNFRLFAPMAGHAIGAFVLMALLAPHVSAALYHQFFEGFAMLPRMGIGKLRK